MVINMTKKVNIAKFVEATHTVPGGVGNWTFRVDFVNTYTITNCEYGAAKQKLFSNPFLGNATFFELEV